MVPTTDAKPRCNIVPTGHSVTGISQSTKLPWTSWRKTRHIKSNQHRHHHHHQQRQQAFAVSKGGKKRGLNLLILKARAVTQYLIKYLRIPPLGCLIFILFDSFSLKDILKGWSNDFNWALKLTWGKVGIHGDPSSVGWPQPLPSLVSTGCTKGCSPWNIGKTTRVYTSSRWPDRDKSLCGRKQLIQ